MLFSKLNYIDDFQCYNYYTRIISESKCGINNKWN